MTVWIEHRPENGSSPWVFRLQDGQRDLWIAYRTEDEAARKGGAFAVKWWQRHCQ